jgi:hypothetical protein
VQRESFSPQANEIPNTAPSCLPGDDYYTNFHVGDPFIKVDQGFARLPGAGYAALHPELKDVDPEDYPDIHKMAILADVAPYSREYHTIRQRVAQQARGDTQLEIEYEKIMNRVKQTRESIIRMNDRHFTAPVDEISGIVDDASAGGVTLKEFPGRRFQFSSVGMSAADLSARILVENNDRPGLSVLPGTKPLARPRRKPPQPSHVCRHSPVHRRSLAPLTCPPPLQNSPVAVSMPAVNCPPFRLRIDVAVLYARCREARFFTRVLILTTHFAGYYGDMHSGIGQHDQSGEFSFSVRPVFGRQQAGLACIPGVGIACSSWHKTPPFCRTCDSPSPGRRKVKCWPASMIWNAISFLLSISLLFSSVL